MDNDRRRSRLPLMAHAKPTDLKDLDVLLKNIRGVETLKEKSIGCFYLKSKSVLHFHIQKGRRFAHVFTGQEWREVDLEENLSDRKQISIFKSITSLLPSVK